LSEYHILHTKAYYNNNWNPKSITPYNNECLWES